MIAGGDPRLLGAGGAERMLKDWMDEMGRTWWVRGEDGDVEAAMATRLVKGQAVKTTPSMVC